MSITSSHAITSSNRHTHEPCGSMLPIYLDDRTLTDDSYASNNDQETVEVTLELEDQSICMCSVSAINSNDEVVLSHRSSARFKRLFSWHSDHHQVDDSSTDPTAQIAREEIRAKAKMMRETSRAQRALNGLRFISRSIGAREPSDDHHKDVLWRRVEERFDRLARVGWLYRENFGECIGMGSSKEFAVGVFDALSRRRRLTIDRITKAELRDFWLQLSDDSFDARLQIFFDMADVNGDGRISRDEIQELIMLSASANKLSHFKDHAEEYTSLIMEELDPGPRRRNYIELWQLESLLLQRDNYMNYSRSLSSTSNSLTNFKPRNIAIKISSFFLENWQRTWIFLLWFSAMASLFTWKFLQYRQRSAFQVMGYCLTTAKGAAETLKLNMALILLPVCRNVLTWLRSTRARFIVPFDDNINFHKVIAFATAIGIAMHAVIHLSCDFPRLISSSPEKFQLIASDFSGVKPTYSSLLRGVIGTTGISMVVLMLISFTLAMRRFRKNAVKLPTPFNRLTGFNAFWYSHHLLGLVYVLLLIHGYFLFFVHQWHQKTTWMYISVPLALYVAERSFRNRRSKHYAVKILKVCVLPGNVLSLVMSKPSGFKYKSGQYVFLQCPTISSFEWHPFSLTSAPGDNYLSVHIRTVGDWTRELNQQLLIIQGNSETSVPKLLVDGPYGAPAQDYRNYDVLLLVGLGIGATPFISIVKDLLNNTKQQEDQMDSSTEARSTSDDSSSSFPSSSSSSDASSSVRKKTRRAYFYWVTRELGSFEWFKGVMDQVTEIDHKGQIEMHNYLTSVYEEGDARSTLIALVQALNHAKHGVDILSGTRIRTHFARPDWRNVFCKVASKHPSSTIGVFYCGMPTLAKELKKLCQEISHKTTTRFEFHKECF